MVTDFVRNNPEIQVLVPGGAAGSGASSWHWHLADALATREYLADVWADLGINRSRLVFSTEADPGR